MRHFTFLAIILSTICGSLLSQPIDRINIEEGKLRGASPILKLSSEDQKAFKERILEVVTELTDKISTIGNKEEEKTYRRSAKEQAVKLFISDTCIVEVSSVNQKKKIEWPIKKYFEHLYALPYYRVKIIFYEIAQVSDLEKAPDGTWVGTAFIYQLFQGKDSEGRLQYEDRTIKRVKIIVRENCKIIGDEELCFPEVKLGDITVTQTRKN